MTYSIIVIIVNTIDIVLVGDEKVVATKKSKEEKREFIYTLRVSLRILRKLEISKRPTRMRFYSRWLF